MSSKVKNSKTYVVLEHGCFGQKTTIGRYLVGAKNPKEAEEILRANIGKHRSVRTYYEEKKKLLKYKEVVKEI